MSDITTAKEFYDKKWYHNFYRCSECGAEWEDTWTSMCNDRCPKCGVEIEPYKSNEEGV